LIKKLDDVVQKGCVISKFIISSVMPDFDPASPAYVKAWRFRCAFKKWAH